MSTERSVVGINAFAVWYLYIIYYNETDIQDLDQLYKKTDFGHLAFTFLNKMLHNVLKSIQRIPCYFR